MPIPSFIQKIAGFFKKISPDCRAVTLLQSRRLDDSISSTELAGLRLHLLLCSVCRKYRRQLEFIRKTAKQADPALAPDTVLSFSARQKMKASLKSPQSPEN